MKVSRSYLVRSLTLALFALSLIGCSTSSGSKLIGQPAPYTRVTMLDGDPVALEQFVGHGKPLVLAFWASTCMYSPRAIEHLDHLAVNLKPRGIQFLAVSIDKADALDDIHTLIKYRDMKNFTHAFSGNDIHDEAYIAFDGSEVPYIIIIDGQGKVVATGDKPSIVDDYFKIG